MRRNRPPLANSWGALSGRALRNEDGLTLVDILVAVMLLGAALLSLVGTVDFSRKLTNQSEVKESAVHRAQRELERISQLPFEAVAHPAGTDFSLASSPDGLGSRVAAGAPARFSYDRRNRSSSEPLIAAGEGRVEFGPTPWSDGRFNGRVYRFVTGTDDAVCKNAGGTASCPASGNYKRITVIVTIQGFDDPLDPAWFSSIVSDPADGPVDAQTSPVTECLNDSGAIAQCANDVGDSVRSLFLTDTPATQSARQAITGSHPTHPTVAPDGTCQGATVSGCPRPDLLEDDPPPGAATAPTLFKYSTDVAGGYAGGRALRRDTSCAATPTASDNTKGAFWVGQPFGSATTLTGEGGMSLFSHAIDGVDAAVTLCLAVYDVPGSLSNLVATPPTEIGRSQFSLASWPRAARRVSFRFDFRGSGVTLAAGRRLGIRVWVASSSGADVALLYDHPSYPSHVQFNEPRGTS